MLQPGDLVLQRYEIEARLGEGGMGAVFRARHIHLDTQVAVKVLHRLGAAEDREQTARFLREARLLAKLNHPNVVRVVDFGVAAEAQGAPCLVLELLEGPSAEDLVLDRGAQPLDLALEVCVAMASALAAAHDGGVLHRDVKPANVVLAADRPRLIDFGIARSVSEDVRLTRVGSVLGTPAYMAPEHLLGQEASVASDLYSLGATLFELCSGELPHDDQSLSALIQGAMAGPPPLVAPGHLEPIPGIFTQLVASLLSPEPTARPATAHQVAASARAIQKETRKRTARARSAWDDFAALASSGKWETQPPPAPRPSIEAASIRSRGSWSRPPAHTLAPPGSEAPGTGKSRGVA